MLRFSENAMRSAETRAYVISRASEVTRKAVTRDLARLAEARARAANTRIDPDARRAARFDSSTIEARIREGAAELRQLGAPAEETRGIESRLESRLGIGSVARAQSADAAMYQLGFGGGGW